MYACDCPQPTALTEIPASDCPFDLRQVQKVVFQRIGNKFDAVNDIQLQATWDALKTAIDSTKVVVSPFVGGNPLITPGGAITEGGGDNSTLNGEETVTGSNPSLFTADFKSLTPEQEVALKKLICEKRLQVYFLNEENKIIVNTEGMGAGEYTGFPISAYYFGDRDNQGFGKQDMHKMRFSLKAGWSENIAKISATDFSPLVDL